MPRIDALGENASGPKGGLTHQAIEDYLKTIYRLARHGSPVSTSRLAEALGFKPASATGMIQRLHKLNLVDYQKHAGVVLTPSGEKIALETIRHHRLIETYLSEALGFGWDEVHEQAEILEHVISEKLEERIAQVLNNPQFDPHGDPIPTREGVMPQRDEVLLVDVVDGTGGRVARIVGEHDGPFLRHLGELGLVPGTAVMLLASAPFDGPLTLEIGGTKQVIGRRIAEAVLIEPDANS